MDPKVRANRAARRLKTYFEAYTVGKNRKQCGWENRFFTCPAAQSACPAGRPKAYLSRLRYCLSEKTDVVDERYLNTEVVLPCGYRPVGRSKYGTYCSEFVWKSAIRPPYSTTSKGRNYVCITHTDRTTTGVIKESTRMLTGCVGVARSIVNFT